MENFLPEGFQVKMKELLKDEFEEFVQSYRQERVQGLRFNTLKCEPEVTACCCRDRFGLTAIIWLPEGYYYQTDKRPGKHPFHEAGVYYIQEPSAMAAAVLLDPQPGERILDLCGAPGGKTTQIAARLQGRGLLVTNEIHPARAKVLSQNIERMGIANAVVCNEESARLAGKFPGFFDRILVDAPCSGEGMFRKEEAAAAEWSQDAVIRCAVRQQEILANAAGMLKPGGRLLYSTCTFSPEENERTIKAFIETHPEFSVEAVPVPEGISGGRADWADGDMQMADTMRIWPHKAAGEGHFFAVLRKRQEDGERKKHRYPRCLSDRKQLADFEIFISQTLKGWEHGASYLTFGEQLYQIPPIMIDFDGLKVLRPGLHLGSLKKHRFEPSHALALHLRPEQVNQYYDMDCDGKEIRRYLAGESLSDNNNCKGWVLMCVNGYSAGWAKASGGMLKNHYPKGLRRQL